MAEHPPPNGPKVYFHIEGFSQPLKFKLSNNCPLSYLFARLPPQVGYYLYGKTTLDPSCTPEHYHMDPGESKAILLTFVPTAGVPQEQERRSYGPAVEEPVTPVTPQGVSHTPRMAHLDGEEVANLIKERDALQDRVLCLTQENEKWQGHAEHYFQHCEGLGQQLNVALAELEHKERENQMLTRQLEELARTSEPPTRKPSPPQEMSSVFADVSVQDILHRLETLERTKTQPSATVTCMHSTRATSMGAGGVLLEELTDYDDLLTEAHQHIVGLQKENECLRAELEMVSHRKGNDISWEELICRSNVAEAEVVRLRNTLEAQTPTLAKIRTELSETQLELGDLKIRWAKLTSASVKGPGTRPLSASALQNRSPIRVPPRRPKETHVFSGK